jgi:hypothetical protein
MLQLPPPDCLALTIIQLEQYKMFRRSKSVSVQKQRMAVRERGQRSQERVEREELAATHHSRKELSIPEQIQRHIAKHLDV